ncbi:MAG: protein-S-isoprenylcysteine methyltransferase [Alphaproteobacteria bacterium]|nr:protein-S-isoprenylcysteine methyltransferase [Alphaproteobacteria bacterium]
MNAESKIASDVRHDPRPRSAVSGAVGLAGLAGLLSWTIIARGQGMDGPFAALTALLACAVPMVLWSLIVDQVHRNPSTGLTWGAPLRPLSQSLDISIAKIAALWATWAVIGSFYCVARWYWNGPYLFAMELLGYAAVPLLVLSIPYVIWIDRRLVDPHDGAWHCGQLIVGRRALIDRNLLYDYFRSWAIKAFFLAFMLSIVPGNWALVIAPDSADVTADPVRLAQWLIAAMFMIDVCFATVGYMLTLKPLDAHIRSAHPYAAGWTAALMCYPPFILMNEGGPLDYHPGAGDWVLWLTGWPTATALLGLVLVFLTGVYAWATIAFGIRFSNLTHRGILTHGPYAWTKHPAYVSKNLFWWLATMPFLATSGSVVDIVRNTVLLAAVTAIYYWRARTEEKHLSADSSYRDYAAWMERNAPLPRLIRKLRSKRVAAPLPAE